MYETHQRHGKNPSGKAPSLPGWEKSGKAKIYLPDGFCLGFMTKAVIAIDARTAGAPNIRANRILGPIHMPTPATINRTTNMLSMII